MERIKLGIIGLGMAWERLHSPALARLQDKFEIAAICDTNIEKAKVAAAFMGLPGECVYSDYKKMLKQANIEAVATMVPIEKNYECAAAVIKSGKHLLAEKPLATTPDAAKKLIELKNKHNSTVMVAENIRFEEENQIIKQLIADGHIGKIVYFTDNNVVEYQNQIETDCFAQREWRQHPNFDGGVLLDSGVHHIARMRFLFGDVLSVAAHGHPTTSDFSPYSCVNALLSFADNVAGHYSFFLEGKETQAPLVGLRIFGTQGEIYSETRGCGFVNVSYNDGGHSAIAYSPSQGYYHELDAFHAAIRLGETVVSTPEKALGDIQIVFDILESIKQGQTIQHEQGQSYIAQMFVPKKTRAPRKKVTS